MNTLKLSWNNVNWRLAPVQTGIVLTFALIPLWYRLPETPIIFTKLYFARFLILLPMVWSIGAWLITGLPGFGAFRRDWPRRLFALALLALGTWAYASQGWAWERIRHPEVAQNAGLQFCVVALFVVVVASAAPPARIIAAVMVFSLFWNAAVTMVQVTNQGPAGLHFLGEFPIGPHQQGISVIQSGALRLMRPYGLLPHPNTLGGILAIGLLAALAWLLAVNRWLRWIGIPVFLLGMWALLLTFSRGAWLGVTAGAVAMLPLLVKRWIPNQHTENNNNIVRHSRLFVGYFYHHRILIITASLSLVTAAIFFLTYQPFLLARTGEGQESIELRSVSDRLVFTEFAYRSISQRPLTGVGAGNFPWRTVPLIREARYDLRGDNVHNVLLSALAELGSVGAGLMIMALVFGVEAVLMSSSNPSSKGSENEYDARIALFGGFMALTFIGLLDHYPYTLIQFQTAWWGLLALSMKTYGGGTSTAGSA